MYEDRIIRLAKAQKPFFKPNILHQFASYNTIFTLSGVSEGEMRTHKFLTNPTHDIIARTGGIGGNANVRTREFDEPSEDYSVLDREGDKRRYREKFEGSISILERRHDLFIENVNMISTASPNPERGLGNFTKIEFEIHEPYGVTLIEKINAATGINGYTDYQDAPLLLTIEFKGLDENGQPVKTQPLVRKIPIGIARVEFDVNEGGARYSVIAVPYPELGYDDRYKFPRINVPVAVSTVEQWARDVETVLNVEMMDKEIEEKKRKLKDVYKFDIHPDVLKYGANYASNETKATLVAKASEDYNTPVTDVGTPQDQRNVIIKKIEGTAGTTTSLTKFFEDAIRTLTGYKDLAETFWVSYLRAANVSEDILNDEKKTAEYIDSAEMQSTMLANQYVDWFKIKTTVETDIEKFDSITKMHPKKIIYQAIPYKIHVLKMITAGVSISGVDWSRQVHKEYNYIYTGENVDVQNLKINYKTAYYLRNVRGDDKGNSEDGLFSWFKDTAKTVFGQERYPEPLKPLRQYPSTNKGRSTLQDADKSGNPKFQEFYDYLTNPEADMIKIELEILGDPAYICQDSYMPIHGDLKTKRDTFKTTYSGEYNSFNSDSFQPIINVVYRIPDDIDEKEGTMFSGDNYRDENLFFNGLYQVNKIESKFDNGQFLQTLFCSRFNNQQGAGTTPLTAAVNSSTSKITKTVNQNNEDKSRSLSAEQILKDAEKRARELDESLFGQ
jgi:hypothetical protein